MKTKYVNMYPKRPALQVTRLHRNEQPSLSVGRDELAYGFIFLIDERPTAWLFAVLNA